MLFMFCEEATYLCATVKGDGNHDREQATAFLPSETVRLAAQGGVKRWKLVKNESKSILATHLASFGRLELRGKEPFQVAL
jgi:hypothetical protein